MPIRPSMPPARPTPPKSSTPAPKPGLPKSALIKNKTIFGDRSQVSRLEFEKYLTKRTTKEELAKTLGVSQNSPEVKNAIDRMKATIPSRFGGFIDKNEAAASMREEFLNEKHDTEKIAQGGVTTQEVIERDRRNKRDKFLKEKLGIK